MLAWADLAQQLQRELAEARADVERLNNLLRARGFGQGEIDNDADLAEQLAQARAALDEVNEIDFWHEKESPWLKAQMVAWRERHAAALKAAREAK